MCSSSVLVVDDDEMVRSFVRKVLCRRGYTVWEAADPDQALRFAEEHQSPVHLLLADIALPWMRGTELFQRFAPHHPETQVIYMSGYTREAIGPCKMLAADGGFIQKPFGAGALMDTVSRVLAL
jgi:DNA-binding NtrC family response regulator